MLAWEVVMRGSICWLLVPGILAVGIGGGAAHAQPQFTATLGGASGGYFTGDGHGCVTVPVFLQETVPGGGSPQAIEGFQMSVAHDGGLLSVASVSASDALVSALGFVPFISGGPCAGGWAVGVSFAPDLVTTPVPLIFTAGMEVLAVRYETVPAAFQGQAGPVQAGLQWVTNACGAAVPVENLVSWNVGASEALIANLVDGGATLTAGSRSCAAMRTRAAEARRWTSRTRSTSWGTCSPVARRRAACRPRTPTTMTRSTSATLS